MGEREQPMPDGNEAYQPALEQADKLEPESQPIGVEPGYADHLSLRREAVERARALVDRVHAPAVPVDEYDRDGLVERQMPPEAERDSVYGRDFVDALDEYDATISRLEARGQTGLLEIETNERSKLVSGMYFEISDRIKRSPTARATLSADIAAQTGETANPLDLIGTLSAEDFEQLVRFHVARTEKLMSEARAQLPGLKAAFSNNVTVLAARQDWPISADDLERRIERTMVTLMDGLEPERTRETHGHFLALNDEVRITVTATEKIGLHHIYNHEMLHAVSGRDARLVPTGAESFGYDVVRSGLRIPEVRVGDASQPALHRRRSGRFVWLNEAVTESAAHEVEGSNDYTKASADAGFYAKEQKLLSRIERRVPRQAIMAAYFESRNPDGPPPQAWGKMQTLIAEAYEPKLLLKLDELIGPSGYAGLDTAIRYMDEKYPADDTPAKGGLKHHIRRLRSKVIPQAPREVDK